MSNPISFSFYFLFLLVIRRLKHGSRGYIATPMLATSLETKFGSDAKNWPKPTTPFTRHGEPEEIGKVIAFLLSDDASYVTAATYSVDGGWASAT